MYLVINMYSQKLKELRLSQNLTKANIAKILKIERITYNHYETQEKIIPIKHLNTLCNYFNVSLDYIFNFTNTPTYPHSTLNINKDISKIRLKELRHQYNLTQNMLAKKLNVSRTTITQYECGINLIATPFLYTICKTYNLSADYLLGKIDSHILITN